MIRSTLLLLLLLLPTSVRADHSCQKVASIPTVTNWTVTAGPGSVVIDATLSCDPGCRPSELYDGRESLPGGGFWYMQFSTRHPDSTYFGPSLYLSKATVTDSTFHIEIPHEAGTFDYSAFIGGTDHDANECDSPYLMEGQITILPDKTPARRVSLGALKARWAR